MRFFYLNLSRRAFLFPLIRPGAGAWTWGQVVAFNRFVLWSLVVGNLVLGGLLCTLFIPGLWRIISSSEMLHLIVESPPVIFLYIFVSLLVLVGLLVTLGAIKLTIYLLTGQRGRS